VKASITDGFKVLAWPEVGNLCRLFGVDLERIDSDRLELKSSARLVGIELRMTDVDVAPILTTVTETTLGRDCVNHPHPGHCFDLYKTSEFKAFCRRLGIPRELLTKAITVRIFEGEQPLTTQMYAMCENGEYPPDETKIDHTVNGLQADDTAYREGLKGAEEKAKLFDWTSTLSSIVSAVRKCESGPKPDVIIDATNLHNREYRTKAPPEARE
jgi:hypothetical protein